MRQLLTSLAAVGFAGWVVVLAVLVSPTPAFPSPPSPPPVCQWCSYEEVDCWTCTGPYVCVWLLCDDRGCGGGTP